MNLDSPADNTLSTVELGNAGDGSGASSIFPGLETNANMPNRTEENAAAVKRSCLGWSYILGVSAAANRSSPINSLIVAATDLGSLSHRMFRGLSNR